MTLGESVIETSPTLQRLLDPEGAAAVLQAALPPEHEAPGEVRVERCWPAGDAEFLLQWSFTQGQASRRCLYARAAAAPPVETPLQRPPAGERGSSNGHCANIFVQVPELNLTVHSPDRDPDLPHLTDCLDHDRVLRHLAPFWNGRSLSSGLAHVPSCRLLGYKPGRRATVAYRPQNATGALPPLLGKTYHKAQGHALSLLHARLNDALRVQTGGRVRVLTPLAYVAELKLALFSWARGQTVGERAVEPRWAVQTAVDVLAALHDITLPDLPLFTPRDECRVMQRWHTLLCRSGGDRGTGTGQLLERLQRVAETIDPQPHCTIHRDYYETQFVLSGRTVTLLDLDTLSCGSPCTDLGNYLAHLYFSLLRQGGAQGFEDLSRDAVERYRRVHGCVDRQALDFYLASSLFRLGAIHALRTQTSRHAGPLWRQTETILRGGLEGRR